MGSPSFAKNEDSENVSIRICFRAVLTPDLVQSGPRMRRKVSPVERAKSIERTFRALAEKLMLGVPSELLLAITSDILIADVAGCPPRPLVSKLQVLRSMKNTHKHDWRSLKRACRIALLELGENASMDTIYSRIRSRGSHNFNGTPLPAVAVHQALTTIGYVDRGELMEITTGVPGS